jgi:hypothetical protein
VFEVGRFYFGKADDCQSGGWLRYLFFKLDDTCFNSGFLVFQFGQFGGRICLLSTTGRNKQYNRQEGGGEERYIFHEEILVMV